ncbi:elongation factor P 5-aminopentanone reductase [Acidaminobacterium chupaoyuni]
MKTVLITGASRGIGAACAEEFARAGYRVAVHYHQRREQAEQVAGRLRAMGAEAACFGADVADAAQVERMFLQIEETLGKIDTLVCNAGIAQNGLLTDFTPEQWRRIFAVDVDGVFYCIRRALPEMIRRKSGSIITISSMWGLTGGSCEVPYSAAKAAVIGLTKALSKEVGLSGVRVNCIAPGVIDTEMNSALGEEDRQALREETPLARIGSPYDVARAAVFLAGESAGFITGQVLSVDGGIATA